MSTELNELLEKAQTEIELITDLSSLDTLRVKYLGKNGLLTQQLKALGSLPAELRPAQGQTINRGKAKIGQWLSEKKGQLSDKALKERLASESIDVTLPGRIQHSGGWHPITQTIEEISILFAQLGFTAV